MLDHVQSRHQIKLAENYIRLERDAEAIAAANKALALEKHPLAYLFLGKIYFELGQNEEAANAFQQSIALDDRSPDAFVGLGFSEQRRGKPEEAAAAFKKAAALAPENFAYVKESGGSLGRAGRHEEAVPILKKAVALNPKDAEAKLWLAGSLLELTRLDEAIPLFAEVDRAQPGNQVINMFLEVARGRQQSFSQIEEMKRFAKQNPDDLKVRLGLMQLLTYARRLPEAEIVIQEVLRANPKDASVYNTIGVLRSTVNDNQSAIAMQKKSLEIKENPTAYANLAGTYSKLGQFDEASKYFQKLFAIKPDSPNFVKAYADLLRDNGKRREALEMYQRCLSMLPTNAPALFNAGILSAKLGNPAAAQQYLETLKTVDSSLAKTLQRFLKFQRTN